MVPDGQRFTFDRTNATYMIGKYALLLFVFQPNHDIIVYRTAVHSQCLHIRTMIDYFPIYYRLST